ncbi:hypothetical protein T484DRAFT_1777987 [Baffinella frigidus]|nr:hypothetical protein T484DRAFT_1777987 [Cryptophyta sp. CCMP2293]
MWLAPAGQPSILAICARITKDLDASSLNLHKVPTEVLQATQLQLVNLRFDGNALRSIPPEIARLSTLTMLDLSRNLLKDVPASLGEMTNLTVLYLNNNKLTRLPLEIGHLSPTVMQRLSISNNRLETPPREILTASTAHLLKYYASSEEAIITDEEIMTASTAHLLKYYSSSEEAIITGTLKWDWCKVMTTMRRITTEVPNWSDLVEVLLDENDISELDVDMCLQMPYLEVLELRRNRIVTIPAGIAAHSTLRRLALSFNRITTLPVEMGRMHSPTELEVEMGRMHSLTELEVAGMQLSAPPLRVLRYGTENTLAYLAALDGAAAEWVRNPSSPESLFLSNP